MEILAIVALGWFMIASTLYTIYRIGRKLLRK